MAEWSIDNDAHIVVHGYLGGHLLHNKSFNNAADLKMQDMSHWHQFSKMARETESRKIAHGMDQFIRLFVGAKFENNNIKPSTAIQKITNALMTKDKTMNELADTVDKIYRFRSEEAVA